MRRLILEDWRGWGDVVCDVEGARVCAHEGVARLATTGKATLELPRDRIYEGGIAQAQSTVNDDTMSPRTRMIEIARLGSDLLCELPLGESFVWPFRSTAVAVQHTGR